MRNIFLNTLTTGIKVAACVLLVSCAGQSSDPLKDYGDVKKVPQTDLKSGSQIAPVSPFVISLKGAAGQNFINMNEGQATQFEIELTPKTLNTAQITDSTLNLIGFEFPSNKPQITKKGPFNYLVSWTPQHGTIPNGFLVNGVSFKVLAQPTDTGLQTLGTEKQFTLIVSKTGSVPKVLRIDGLPEKAQESPDKLKFSVLVEDPNYNGIKLPRVTFPTIGYSNDEAFVASGHKFIDDDYDRTAEVSGKRIRFHYTMNLENLPVTYNRKRIVDANAAYVEICFDVLVLSSNGVVTNESGDATNLNSTTDAQKCLTAYYSAQPAQIVWTDKADRKVKAGQENTFNFTLSTLNSLSSLEIINANNQIRSLNGEKSITCTSADEKNTKLECVLNWKPTTVCGTRRAFPTEGKQVEVSFKSTATLNTTKKELTHKEIFEVTDFEADCGLSHTVVQPENKP